MLTVVGLYASAAKHKTQMVPTEWLAVLMNRSEKDSERLARQGL